jgi:hypothetical protein
MIDIGDREIGAIGLVCNGVESSALERRGDTSV